MYEELEQVRKKAINKTIICIFTFILIGLLLYPFLSFTAIGLFIPGIIISVFITRKEKVDFNKLYKQIVVVESIKQICSKVTYDSENGIKMETIKNANLMFNGDIFNSFDYITGIYNNIQFEMSDILIQNESTDSDGTTYNTIFNGTWFIFNLNKGFKSNVHIYRKGFNNVLRFVLYSNKERKVTKIDVQNKDFNKTFKVYALNEIDANNILTINTINNIKELSSKINGKLYLNFEGKSLHIAINNSKDLFNTSIYKKINIPDSIEKTKQDLIAITDFVDKVNLDNNLFNN